MKLTRKNALLNAPLFIEGHNLLCTVEECYPDCEKAAPKSREATIEKLLAVLEEAKERGIIGDAFPNGIPEWAGPDSNRVTEECPICHEDKAPAEMETCAYCEQRYCRECIERHAAWVSGGRWG